MPTPLPTSFLFVPANRPDRFAKAMNAGATAVIIDLEDSVAEQDKVSARENIKTFAETGERFWVRINAPKNKHHQADIALIADCPTVLGVVVPKVEFADSLNAVHFASQKPMIAVIETAQGFANVRALAQGTGVVALSYGVLDLAQAFGVAMDDDSVNAFFDQVRFSLVLESKLANLSRPIESIFANFKDTKGLTKYAQHAFAMGFGGQLCIHPNQVSIVNASYRSSDEKLNFAKAVLAKYEQTGDVAFAIDGIMVDLPVIEWASHILNNTNRQ